MEVALIFSQSICRLEEILTGQKGEEVGPYDEHEFWRKTSWRTDDVVDGGELGRDGGESCMEENCFGDMESHGEWEVEKACGSISSERTSSVLRTMRSLANPDPLRLAFGA